MTINTTANKHKNKLGIWMDHSTAHFIEYTEQPLETKVINSKFTHQQKEQALVKSEYLMHNKEQHQQHEFYKEIAEIILNFSEVILFGPTDAKTELFNILKANHSFENIKIVVKQADKMTDNQQHAFVRNHFS